MYNLGRVLEISLSLEASESVGRISDTSVDVLASGETPGDFRGVYKTH